MAYTKHTTPPEAALVEAAGLRWLAAADGGPRIARVLSVQRGQLEIDNLGDGSPSVEAAEALGAALAHMHNSLAEGALFGQLPDEHPAGMPPLFGPAEALFEVGADTYDSWGAFHARERLDPVLQRLSETISMEDAGVLAQARNRIAAGDFDDELPPARLHGDLWSGNVLWTPEGAALIDPAAHVGHRESDLAMLQLFGLPHLDVVLEAYQATSPLADGWEDRVAVHQLFYLAVHWLLFGGAYSGATLAAAQRTLEL